MIRRKHFLLAALAILTLVVGASISIFLSLQNKLHTRLAKGWIIPPLELYSQGIYLGVGRKIPLNAIQDELRRRDLKPDRDYVLGEVEACALEGGPTLKDEARRCLWLKHLEEGPLVVTWDENDWITEIWGGEPWGERESQALFPRLITQFSDGQPIQQQNTVMSETPLACLQAVTAIEDREFLEHVGISATGIGRALIRNIKAGRFAEGGSTITQQLVKVFLLNSKKTLSRKVEEQILAVILESQLSKDQILEMYLNVIYMGQNGPYQVRGMASAAEYYFDKSLSNLGLSECALLAALINNPGRYSPFSKDGQQARLRRELVLRKMAEAGMISSDELSQAAAQPLPRAANPSRRAHAPYFVISALKEYTALELDSEEGARLYTTLDPDLQAMLTNAIQAQLPGVEKRIKKPAREPLQVAALVVDLSGNEVLALAGGRDFRTTQFNRAREGRRQIGSIVKPFVYLPAMREHSPLSKIVDAPFEWKTGRQTWKPKNYSGKAHGTIPYFYALAESLNIPTARVAHEISIDVVAQTLTDAGVREKITPMPSVSLGALELPPFEVAQIYATLARMGAGEPIHSLVRVENLKGEVLFSHQVQQEFQLDPKLAAVTIGMLEQSLTVGTATSARAMGLTGAFAGKTGTTSDTKDAWFAGFSPRLLTVVWVGYDDNTPMGLTGGGAALPIWTQFNKEASALYAPRDFAWPEGVSRKTLSRSEVMSRYPDLNDVKNWPEEIQITVDDSVSEER